MNNSPVKVIRMDGKTINPQDLPPEAWNIVFGKSNDTDLQDIYSKVSWCFRAIDILANNMRIIPFIIENTRGEKVDDSTTYANAVGFLPKPRDLFQLIEMSLNIFGYGYLYRLPNVIGGTYDLRYMVPTSIKPTWAKDMSGRVTGLAGFKRTGIPEILKTEDVIYFWRPDPFVEFGPSESSPLKAAASEAGVILNMNNFSSLYFERGLVKATILAVSGNPNEVEKARIKSLWQRLMTGVKGLFGEMVVNVDGIKPVVIGGGLEELSDTNLTKEKREAIASAIGIPHSLLFSGAANYAVSQQDEVNLYNQKIIPDCDFIEDVLNDQLFTKAGYKLRFTPESMDIFQEDESKRAASMNQFITAMQNVGSIELAKATFEIFGYEIPDEAMAFIEQHFAAKAESVAATTPQLSPVMQMQEAPMEEPQKRTDIERWQTKAIKAMKAGKSPSVTFESEEIPLSLQGAISGALEAAETIEEVKNIFSDVWAGYP